MLLIQKEMVFKFSNLFPGDIDTFNSVLYRVYIFKDENKINKEWPNSNYYSRSYGFGYVPVTVYIGE